MAGQRHLVQAGPIWLRGTGGGLYLSIIGVQQHGSGLPFTLENLYRKQLEIPSFTREQLAQMVEPLLEYYPARDRELIADRVCETVLLRQKCR